MISLSRSLVSIVGRELHTRPRHRGFYLIRSGIAALALFVLWIGAQSARWQMGGAIGLHIFRQMSITMLIVTYLAAPWWAAQGVMDEKEQRTLPLLWLTDFLPSHILAGKLISSTLHAVLAAVVLVPLMLLCVVFGGVSAGQILLALVVLVSLAVLGSGVGLLAGSLARSERQLSFLLPALAIAWYVVPPVLVMFLQWWPGWFGYVGTPHSELWYRLGNTTCALTAMRRLNYGMPVSLSLLNVGFNLVAGIAMTGLSGLLLRRRLDPQERPSLWQRWRARLHRSRLHRRLPPIRSNPVAWRDYCIVYSGTWRNLLKVSLILGLSYIVIWSFAAAIYARFGVAGGMTYWEAVVMLAYEPHFLQFSFGMQLVICTFILLLRSVAMSSKAFIREKRARSVEVLLTTTLTDEDLIIGKISAILLNLLPWLLATVGWGLMLWMMNDLAIEREFFYAGIYVFSIWIGYSSLAFYLSTVLRRNLGFFICMVVYVVWMIAAQMAYTAIDFVFNVDNELLLYFHVLGHLALGVVCVTLTFAGLRRNLLR